MASIRDGHLHGPALVLVVLVLTAGCSAVTAPDGPAPGGGSEPAETPQPITSVAPATNTTSCDCVPGGPGFELHDIYDGTVTVTVSNVTGNTHSLVAERTYTDRDGWYDFGPVTRYRSDYRVVVRVDGSEAWNETVSRAEAYEVRVESDGSVTVVSEGGV